MVDKNLLLSSKKIERKKLSFAFLTRKLTPFFEIEVNGDCHHLVKASMKILREKTIRLNWIALALTNYLRFFFLQDLFWNLVFPKPIFG